MATPEDRMMENLYWWGVPTMFRAPHTADPTEADIALIGAPHSTGNGTTERDQHLGPRAVRNVSAVGRRVHLDFGLDPWEAARIRDLGDVPFPEANDNEACIQRITDFLTRIDQAGARPVTVGGDHSITGGVLQALGGGKLAGGQSPYCILMRIPMSLLRSTISLGPRSQQRIGALIWLIRARSIQPNLCRSAFVAIPGRSTGCNRPMTTATMSSP